MKRKFSGRRGYIRCGERVFGKGWNDSFAVNFKWILRLKNRQQQSALLPECTEKFCDVKTETTILGKRAKNENLTSWFTQTGKWACNQIQKETKQKETKAGGRAPRELKVDAQVSLHVTVDSGNPLTFFCQRCFTFASRTWWHTHHCPSETKHLSAACSQNRIHKPEWNWVPQSKILWNSPCPRPE